MSLTFIQVSSLLNIISLHDINVFMSIIYKQDFDVYIYINVNSLTMYEKNVIDQLQPYTMASIIISAKCRCSEKKET